MDYSIIIPVFNKAEFTRRCLETLRASLEGAGDGEVIVVDNASTDETPEVLAEFPWIRLIRNETNLGYAAANNQGARIANGEFLALLNNDTEAFPGWLASMIATAREFKAGVVGARLLFGDGTIQHAGVVASGGFFTRQRFSLSHFLTGARANDPRIMKKQEFQFVTGACMVTPRALYNELGGLNEAFWNGYEDMDYCFKARAAGHRIMYDPGAKLTHFESQSGAARLRRSSWNARTLVERWSDRVVFDAGLKTLANNELRRYERSERGGLAATEVDGVPVSVIVHTAEPAHRGEFEQMLRRTGISIGRIVWATGDDWLDVAREATAVRGLRHVAFVDGRAELLEGWLEELVREVEMTPNSAAATCVPEVPTSEDIGILACDARCTVISLYNVPPEIELRAMGNMNAAVADFLLRVLPLGRGSRGVGRSVAVVPEVGESALFSAAHGIALREIYSQDAGDVERVVRGRTVKPRGLVSIVMLSWNAPQFTRMALDSIRAFTSEPYEIVLVDNGSGEETQAMLRAIDDPHVRIIYNATNRGFAGGNNDGLAAARGNYIVLMNNDVTVTEHWLDDLLDPFDRIPGLGVTAPRSNKIAGRQLVYNAVYSDGNGLAAFARARRARWRKRGYITDRVIGFCLCIDRSVIEHVGGLDEAYGMGNFEDDDFCIRVRGAGYKIYVCDDVFIHHFGSQSFQANNVDYRASMLGNWAKFTAKWGYEGIAMENGYDPRSAIFAGFNRARDFVPLPPDRSGSLVASQAVLEREARALVFVVSVKDEDGWSVVAEFVKRFAQAFVASDPAVLMIATFADPTAETIGRRVERTLEKLAITDDVVGDIEIFDADDEAWREAISARRVVDVADLKDRSPSGLRRLLAQVRA